MTFSKRPVTFKVDAHGCHVCTSHARSNGYPMQSVRGQVQKVSRLVWQGAHGTIPAGLMIRHLCHNRACINLAHLAVGTRTDNVRDSALIGVNASPLTLEQATAIRSADSLAEAIRLGVGFGVTEETAKNIRSGKTWKYLSVPVPDPRIHTLALLPDVLTIPEAAAVLRISPWLAYEMQRRGELPAVRIGRRLVVPKRRLLEMLGG